MAWPIRGQPLRAAAGHNEEVAVLVAGQGRLSRVPLIGIAHHVDGCLVVKADDKEPIATIGIGLIAVHIVAIPPD